MVAKMFSTHALRVSYCCRSALPTHLKPFCSSQFVHSKRNA